MAAAAVHVAAAYDDMVSYWKKVTAGEHTAACAWIVHIGKTESAHLVECTDTQVQDHTQTWACIDMLTAADMLHCVKHKRHNCSSAPGEGARSIGSIGRESVSREKVSIATEALPMMPSGPASSPKAGLHDRRESHVCRRLHVSVKVVR